MRESRLALPDAKDQLIRRPTFSEFNLSLIGQRRRLTSSGRYALCKQLSVLYLRFLIRSLFLP